MLVDGYNVCGYWPKLKKHFMKGRLDVARRKLIDELITFSVLKEVKVVVVFDAMLSGLPNHKEAFAGIDVVFSAETCADAWIEKEIVALKADGCPKVWVVTSDSCQQQAAHGAGAFVWSCKALVSEIKASQQEFEQILEEHSCRLTATFHIFVPMDCLETQNGRASFQLTLIWGNSILHFQHQTNVMSTSMQGKLLQHNLRSEVVDALKDLKRKLSESESS